MIEWLIYALFIAGLYLFYKLCRLIGSLIDRLTSYIKGDETEHVHKQVEREPRIRSSRNNEERPSRKPERPNSNQRECQPTQKPIHEVRRSAFDPPERYCPRVVDVSLPGKEDVNEYYYGEHGQKILHSQYVLASFPFFGDMQRTIHYMIDDKEQNLAPHPSDGRGFSDELTRLASDGDVSAQYALALCRFDTSSSHYHFGEFLFWMQLVATSSDKSKWKTYANLFLAECYRDGKYSFPIDEKKAFEYYERSYDPDGEGFANTCYALCRKYDLGTRCRGDNNRYLKPLDDDHYGDADFFFREFIASMERLSNRNNIAPGIKRKYQNEVARRQDIQNRYLNERDNHINYYRELRDMQRRYKEQDPEAAIWFAKMEFRDDEELCLKYYMDAQAWGADVEKEIETQRKIIRYRAYECEGEYIITNGNTTLKQRLFLILTQEELNSIVDDGNKALLNQIIIKNDHNFNNNDQIEITYSMMTRHKKENFIITNPETLDSFKRRARIMHISYLQ